MPDLFIGLMSGTSVDAVDGALVDLAAAIPVTLGFRSRPMPSGLRAELLALQSSGADEIDRAARAAVALSRLYAEVALELAEAAGVRTARADGLRAIGAHGQTVRHRPERGYTTQLIDGALLAELTGTAVVCDFRSADIAAAGQGAPLVPAFHAAVFAHPERRRAIVNIGGIANLSLLAPGEPVRGFDCGPGNVLLDGWCESRLGERFDRDGRWARTGRIDPALLDEMLAEPYFGLPAPKSTGRDLFNTQWLQARLAAAGPPAAGRSDADVQATLLELTARTIARAARESGADDVYACGGGTRNRALMARLADLLAPATLASTTDLGLAAEAVEATAFAWLAARRLAGLPGNLPAVTGARGPRVLGALYSAPPSSSGRE
jgi:anhydro-N-acetylmuramic acid kinase